MNTPINDGGSAFPAFLSIPGYGCSKPVTQPNGEVQFEEHSPGMSLRAWLTGKAIQGFLASESEDNGQLYEYRKDPNTGLQTHRKEVYPLNPETKMEDYSQNQIPTILVFTAEQHLVHRAIQIADEAILQLSQPKQPKNTTP